MTNQINQQNNSNKTNSLIDKYLLFFKKTLKYWFLTLIISSVWIFIFMFIIIFHHKISASLSIFEYLMFGLNLIISCLLIYASYIYSNKSFWCNIAYLISLIFFLIFIIPITIYFHAELQSIRINDTTNEITIYLTHKEYVYTAISLWLCFIFSGILIASSITGFYFASKISNKPWKVRIENERVISKPKN